MSQKTTIFNLRIEDPVTCIHQCRNFPLHVVI